MDHARRVLEFDAVLVRLAAHCQTETARQMALASEASPDRHEVWEQLSQTLEAHQLLGVASPPSLGAVRDLAGHLEGASKGLVLGGVELAQLRDTLVAMRQMKQFLAPKSKEAPSLAAFGDSLPNLPKLEQALEDSIDPGGDVRDSASAALATVRQRKRGLQNRLLEKIQQYTTKHRDLLSDGVYTVRDGRYVIPVKAEHKHKIKGIVHDSSASGATVYVEPEDVLQTGNQLREAEGAEREEVQRILARLSALAGASASEVATGIRAAAEIDLRLARAKLAYDMKAGLPERREGPPGMEIHGGRHPLLEAQGVAVVPLDLTVGFGQPGLLITGPNTGGKTVAIKCVGLFTLMAQSGLFLPARHVVLSPFTQVWADIGDEQSLQQSLSTFSGHIRNIAAAIKGLKEGALVLFDEIGAGTDPAEGAALAKAILRALVDRGACVVASTHYGELKAFAYEEVGFANAAMEFDPKTLRPTFRLLMGAPGASHALKIAERHGIPGDIVKLAHAYLDTRAAQTAAMFESLELAQKRARAAQSEADRTLNELRRAEKRAEEKLAEAEEIRRKVHAQAQAQIEEELRKIRAEAAALFEELKKSVDQRKLNEVREGLRDVQRQGQEAAGKFQSRAAPKPSAPLVAGMTVKADGYSQVGVVLEDPKGDTALVQMGAVRLKLPVGTLKPVEARAGKGRGAASLIAQRAQSASTEIHLRAMRAEDAEEVLQKFIDEAVLAGLHQVRIVHGKGEGILRRLVQDFLRRHQVVKSFRDGEPGEGGQGVTIAVFK